VCGYLDLGSLTSIPDGFNPTVGGDLDLGSLTSIPDGFNPTVGGGLYWKNNSKRIGANVPQIKKPVINLSWEDGKYRKVDGIFCEILTERESVIEGETFIISSSKKVNKEVYFFIAMKGEYSAHADDLRKAISDLQFKIVAEKLKKEPINPDTEITINHYRLITGACEFGVKNWMEQNGIKVEKIKAIDLMPILKKTNAYGFERFKSLVTF
jgi:predicted peroxiredoxin